MTTAWRRLLCSLPGYDPFADSEGCWFAADAAQLPIDFIEECLHHVEGELAGRPFLLEEWQKAIVANLFGWQRRDENVRLVRRYRELLLYVPRKNGKTPLAAAIALFIFFCDEEPGQQNYIAAADRDQAAMLFRQARGMVEQEPELSARCRIYGGNAAAGQSRSLVRPDGSFLRVISADANTKHGGNTHLALVDELHAQANRELVDVLETSMASQNRAQPLLILITTADVAGESICNEKYHYAKNVLAGVIRDPAFLPAIFAADTRDDWRAEKTWRTANPNLGVSVSLDYLRRKARKAAETPAFENTFKRLHLNIRTEQATRAINLEKWDAAAHLREDESPAAWRRRMLADLAGSECVAGLDLGATADLTALVLCFPHDDDRCIWLPFFWAPRLGAEKRQRADKVPYLTWAEQGFITLTEGDVTDYDVVRADLTQLGQSFPIRTIAVDRLFQGAQLCTQLMDDGFDVVAFGQGFASMAAPVKRVLELILAEKIEHGGNPVLRWNVANAACETDAHDNQKFSKKKSKEKIDGLVAGAMAVGQWLAEPAGGPDITWI